MNHIAQRNKLDKQMSSYVAFFKIANRSQSVKLSKEIAKLSNRIDTIDQMPYSDQIKTLDEHFETKQSKLNFKTIEITTDMSSKKRNAPENCHPIHDEAKDSRRRILHRKDEFNSFWMGFGGGIFSCFWVLVFCN